jgi:hypothetical protein
MFSGLWRPRIDASDTIRLPVALDVTGFHCGRCTASPATSRCFGLTTGFCKPTNMHKRCRFMRPSEREFIIVST